MSSSRPGRALRGVAPFLAILSLTIAAGCTVQPLYGSAPGGAVSGPAAALPSIAVDPVSTRDAQQVRNHLIFLLNGGAAEPASPAYRVKLSIATRTLAAATIQRVSSTEREPTAGRIVMNGTYEITSVERGSVARGTRQATASFDQPGQEFAVERAERDAVDRAARELAEIIRLAIAQDLLRQK